MEGLRIDHQRLGGPWDSEADRGLTEGLVDLVLLVTEPHDDGGHAAFLADAVAVLSADATIGAVGRPHTATAPAHPLAPAAGDLLVRADALRLVGGLGEAPPGAGYDVDLCARLWAIGFRVATAGVPSDAAQPPWTAELQQRLTEAIALLLDDEDLEGSAWRAAEAAAPLAAVTARRAALSPLRQRGSGELVPMLHEWVAQWSAAGGPPEAVELVERLGALDRAGPRRRVLVVTMDVLAPSMAGPAIRATAIATALAREHDVRLVTTSRCELERPDLDVRGVSDAALEGLVGWADVVILQGWVMVGRPWIASSSCVVVVDAYDPMHLEQLEQGRDAGGTRGRVEAVRGATATLNEQLRRADLVLCASDKQRDLWLGALATLGRVNPVTYDVDPSMGHLIAVVPFGVPDEPFPDGAGALKGVVPGIGVDDHVLLWGGGVYNWFDPLTLVQAVDALRHRVPTVRLYFMGMQHPNPGVAPMQMASDLRRLSDERGLTDVHVFFNAGWVAFEDRAGYLRDADIGVSTHLDHVETAFSFRTRLLDYLWAGLPIVATRGDSFAPLIDERGAGCTVDAQDVAGLEAALEAILLDPSRAADAAAASRGLGAELTWAHNLQPLLAFCQRPGRAPDIACPTLEADPRDAGIEVGWRRDLRALHVYLRDGGPRVVWRRATGRLRRRWAELRHR